MREPAAGILLALLPLTLARETSLVPQAGPTLDALGGFGWLLAKTLLVLAILLAALLLASKWLMRKLRQRPFGGRGKLIEVVEIHPLEPRKYLYLVRVAGQFFLIGSSEGRLQTLAGGPLDADALAAALEAARKTPADSEPKPAGRTFAELLERPAQGKS